jgi:hypothetical protein
MLDKAVESLDTTLLAKVIQPKINIILGSMSEIAESRADELSKLLSALKEDLEAQIDQVFSYMEVLHLKHMES